MEPITLSTSLNSTNNGVIGETTTITSKHEFSVDDDGIYENIPVGPSISKCKLVLPKEVFIEAYKKYILGNVEEK